MKQDIICTGPPDAETLGAAVGEFLRTVRPERQRLYDYYRGEQSVDKGETVRGRHRHLLPGGAADRRGPAASADGFGEEAGRGAGKHHAPRRQDRQ